MLSITAAQSHESMPPPHLSGVYVVGLGTDPARGRTVPWMSGCLFCRIAARSEPAHLVLETDRVVGFLDNRPVFKGHVLLVTRRHVETLTELPDELLAPFFAATRAVAAAIRDSLGAQGSSDAITLG